MEQRLAPCFTSALILNPFTFNLASWLPTLLTTLEMVPVGRDADLAVSGRNGDGAAVALDLKALAVTRLPLLSREKWPSRV